MNQFENGNLSDEFYSWLEYHLSKTFKSTLNVKYRWLWCDGVVNPINSIQTIISEKKIITEAFIGVNGQDKYDMVIKLGECSINNLKKETSLIDCVPGYESFDWVTIDIDNKIIKLQLK